MRETRMFYAAPPSRAIFTAATGFYIFSLGRLNLRDEKRLTRLDGMNQNLKIIYAMMSRFY